MSKRIITALVAIFALTSSVGVAADSVLPSNPVGDEVAFVSSVTRDLNARFPTPAAAEKSGYFRYTNEDRFGAISYTNMHWQSTDPRHPSQLWYSANGKLLGADFSMLRSTSQTAPKRWGISPQRWVRFRSHVHYVLVEQNGSATYASTPDTAFAAAGGDIDKPQATTLVNMGIAKTESSIKQVFLFPAMWDLEIWVTQNPSGAFAHANPLVKPSANATDEGA